MPDSEFSDFTEETIEFHNQDIDFEPTDQSALKDWITATIAAEGGELTHLNFIFCSDDYLHDLNVEYLQHDTLTDVITFPYSDDTVEGDIFISVERITDNAKKFGVSTTDELHRVMIHGVLHLLGYGDKKPKEEKI